MGYAKIPNLYKAQDVLLFKTIYAMSKLHGTSAHITWNGELHFFSGGAKQDQFEALFDKEKLTAHFKEMGVDKIKVYGEAYGGKLQGMSKTYGKELKFAAFEVQIDDMWLNVPTAEKVVKDLGLEFVHYKEIPATMEAIEAEMKADSVQAIRNGMGEGHRREGVVLRPPIEVRKNNGERVMAKYKNEEFQEIVNQPKVGDKWEVDTEAESIAERWTTTQRLNHVIDGLGFAPEDLDVDKIGTIVVAMIADIETEGKGEVVVSKTARKYIGGKTVKLFKKMLTDMESNSPQATGF